MRVFVADLLIQSAEGKTFQKVLNRIGHQIHFLLIGDNHVLLEASYNDPSHGYVQSEFGTDKESHPQMYLHPHGDGQVLYLTLGHCRGKYDLRPLMDIAPVERCAWNYPVFYELLRRGIAWGISAD